MNALEPTDRGTSHYLHSTLRERIVEHVFVGETLRRMWQRGVTDVEVLRSEFDVLERLFGPIHDATAQVNPTPVASPTTPSVAVIS